METPFLGIFGPRKQNCQFKQKLGTKNNCNIQNSIVHFFWFSLEIPFLSKFDPKNKDCQFNLRVGTYTNSNIENSMRIPFWASLVSNFKIDCLK